MLSMRVAKIIIWGVLLLAIVQIVRHTMKPKAELAAIYRVSAYCPCEICCGRWADGVTASGHVIQPGDKFVASPKNVPFGTMFTVPGYNNGKPVPASDRGGAIKGNRFDVFFPTHQEALNWGVQYLNVKTKMKGKL